MRRSGRFQYFSTWDIPFFLVQILEDIYYNQYSLDRISQVLETLKILEPGLTVRIDIWLPHILFLFTLMTYILLLSKSEQFFNIFIFQVRKARLLQELHLPLLMLAQTHLSQVIGVEY